MFTASIALVGIFHVANKGVGGSEGGEVGLSPSRFKLEIQAINIKE